MTATKKVDSYSVPKIFSTTDFQKWLLDLQESSVVQTFTKTIGGQNARQQTEGLRALTDSQDCFHTRLAGGKYVS